MILNGKTDVKVLSEGQSQGSIGMQLDSESSHILMTMLSKNLYSDSIGSTIRETASNALDSHRRIGSESPIIVSFGTNAQNNYEYTVEDFGSGLDNDDVENIISKYGKSTKRNSNTELGCFGLGFKAPLSYSSTFFFVCRKDSIERKYMMYEGEEGNSIDLLYEQVTDEPNGVKIIVPVEYKDRYHFADRIKEQLAYFENVYFNVEGISNNFTILREVDFQISQINHNTNMHICLDNVYYPIDWNKLGINPINIGVGLRFSLTDGLYPTPSRENLIYAEKTKQIILDKIKVVSEFIVNKYNEDMKEVAKIKEIFNYFSGDTKYVNLNNYKFAINPVLHYSDVKVVQPKLKGVEKLDLKYLYHYKDYLIKEYKVNYILKSNTMSFVKNNYYNSELKESNFPRENIYLYNEEISHLKKEFLKHEVDYKTVYLIKKFTEFKLFKREVGSESLYSILGLKYKPREEWRQIITEFREIQKEYINQFYDVDVMTPTVEWLEDRKKKKRVYYNPGRKSKLTGEISCKMSHQLERSNGNRNCKFVPETLQLEGLHKIPKLHVYTKHDDYLLLDAIFNTTHMQYGYTSSTSKERLILFTVSPSEYKKLEQLDVHNLISYEKFMEGDNKVFRRMITAQLIYKLINKNSKVFEQLSFIKSISVSLHDKMKVLETYKKENYYSINDDVFKAMLDVAEDKNLFDTETYILYQEMKAVLEKFSFLNSLLNRFKVSLNADKEELLTILIDLFKYHKFKIDYIHYTLPVKEEEPVVEETED